MANWFEALAPEEQAHIAGKGWDKLTPEEAAVNASRSHFEAQKLIGHPPEQVLKVPKDASDPSYQSAYDRIVGLGAPKDPSEYTFDGIKFKDGTDLAAEDLEFVRGLAAKHKMPVHVARDMAETLAARTEALSAAETNTAEMTKAANTALIRQTWGADYDMKAFSATRAAEAAGLPVSILSYLATLPGKDYVEGMNSLVALGQKMGEAAMLRGGNNPPRDNTAGLTAEAAEIRLATLQADAGWVQKFMAGDATTRDEWGKLTTIIAGARAPQR